MPHGLLRLNHDLGIGCHLLCPCGSDAVGRWIGDGGPCSGLESSSAKRALLGHDPAAYPTRTLARGFIFPFTWRPSSFVLWRRLTCTPPHPGIFISSFSFCPTIAPLRLSNVGYS